MVVLASVLVTAARADEEKVPLDKVPKAVLDAVKAKFEGAKLLGAAKEKEDGKTIYEITLEHKGFKIDASFTEEGKVVSIEKTIPAKDLPKAVSEALEAKYPKSTIKLAEEVTEDEKVKFEVVIVTAENKKLEVVLDREGKVLKEEKKDKD
jgi:uncharacterized membrane protein YkoI